MSIEATAVRPNQIQRRSRVTNDGETREKTNSPRYVPATRQIKAFEKLETSARAASLRSEEHCSARSAHKPRGAMLRAPFKWAFCKGLNLSNNEPRSSNRRRNLSGFDQHRLRSGCDWDSNLSKIGTPNSTSRRHLTTIWRESRQPRFRDVTASAGIAALVTAPSSICRLPTIMLQI
jgi:hypothetical protein